LLSFLESEGFRILIIAYSVRRILYETCEVISEDKSAMNRRRVVKTRKQGAQHQTVGFDGMVKRRKRTD
jgi:hypothetical protein